MHLVFVLFVLVPVLLLRLLIIIILRVFQKSLRLCSFKSDRGEICYSSEYASTDGVRFIIWHHTCKMASTMSFHEKA